MHGAYRVHNAGECVIDFSESGTISRDVIDEAKAFPTCSVAVQVPHSHVQRLTTVMTHLLPETQLHPLICTRPTTVKRNAEHIMLFESSNARPAEITATLSRHPFLARTLRRLYYGKCMAEAKPTMNNNVNSHLVL